MFVSVVYTDNDSSKQVFWGSASEVLNFLCGFSLLEPDLSSVLVHVPEDEDSSYDLIVHIYRGL